MFFIDDIVWVIGWVMKFCMRLVEVLGYLVVMVMVEFFSSGYWWIGSLFRENRLSSRISVLIISVSIGWWMNRLVKVIVGFF